MFQCVDAIHVYAHCVIKCLTGHRSSKCVPAGSIQSFDAFHFVVEKPNTLQGFVKSTTAGPTMEPDNLDGWHQDSTQWKGQKHGRDESKAQQQGQQWSPAISTGGIRTAPNGEAKSMVGMSQKHSSRANNGAR